MNANYKSIVFAISLFFASSVSIAGAPGDLDPTFGSGGIVITNGGVSLTFYYAWAMAIQSDGKIIVVGEGATPPFDTYNWDFAVVRYNPDGTLDSSFGDSGIVITPLGGNFDQPTSVAIQTDGKIVVAGVSGGSPRSFALVRYNTDGSLDASFNGTGKVITPVGTFGEAHSVAIQADGKIVVAGFSGHSPTLSFALVRYNTDGSLDASFNGTGKVITPGGGATSVAIQSDGKIIAAGESRDGTNPAFTLIRYNADGTLDTSFNGTGKVITPGGGATSVAIQSDGKIVAAGYSLAVPGDFRTSDFALVRYNPNGSLDSSFVGTGNILIPDSNLDWANSVAIQSNGKIVVAGNTSLNFESAVVRLNPNGSLDTSFNGTGIVLTSFGSAYDHATSVAIQADGKIVVAGDTGPDEFKDFVVVRYQGDATLGPNPIDAADFFIRQQYLDFLDRPAEPEGLEFYVNILNGCHPSDIECIKYTRGALSANFFRSPEFGRKGAYVANLFNIVIGQRPKTVLELSDPTKVERPHYAEFMADLTTLSTPDDDLVLTDQKKDQLASAWLARTEVQMILPSNLSSQQFVEKLESIAGVTLANESTLIANLNNGSQTRAQVLRAIAESNEVVTKFYIPNFVTMEYLGYLRRDPEDCHVSSDPENCGYIFHNRRFNIPGANPDLIENIIVRGFIESPEYRRRFGP